MADAGADTLQIKRHGGSKSITVAEGYVTDSVVKEEPGNRITNIFLKEENEDYFINENDDYPMNENENYTMNENTSNHNFMKISTSNIVNKSSKTCNNKTTSSTDTNETLQFNGMSLFQKNVVIEKLAGEKSNLNLNFTNCQITINNVPKFS